MNFGAICRDKLDYLDWPLMVILSALLALGLVVLYSASSANSDLIHLQYAHIALGGVMMLITAFIPAHYYYRWSVWIYIIGIILLIAVLIFGHIGKGAQRWLNLGILRFQPSEIMKLACPLMLSWYVSLFHIPPRPATIVTTVALLLLPVLLIAKQPDLGTAVLVLASGMFVLLLSGLRLKLIFSSLIAFMLLAPMVWYFMHDYQKMRVISFFDPERDPLGNGYHIIQSKIALGSGGVFGHGYLQSSQAHLRFLPEHTTDFIFAVFGEEFGLIGSVLLFSLYFLLIARCLWLSWNAPNTFARLSMGSLTLTFFVYIFVNVGMVSGILPVVGLPLPLLSYGGTAIVTLMTSFGIIMSLNRSQKNLLLS